jgi:hypothetical protein
MIGGVGEIRQPNERAPAGAASHRGARLAAAWFVLLLLAAGSLALWIGIPAGSLWLASHLSESTGLHLPIALAVMIPAMFAGGALLSWLNLLYLRITGGEVVGTGAFRVRRKGPLEPLMVVSIVIAVICLFVWFFFFAENPNQAMFG